MLALVSCERLFVAKIPSVRWTKADCARIISENTATTRRERVPGSSSPPGHLSVTGRRKAREEGRAAPPTNSSARLRLVGDCTRTYERVGTELQRTFAPLCLTVPAPPTAILPNLILPIRCHALLFSGGKMVVSGPYSRKPRSWLFKQLI